MIARETLEAGKNTIEAESEFTDGYCNGNLYYYDTNHQLARPLTSKAISRFMLDNLHDTRTSVCWNAGFVCGWLVAMCENNPTYFFTSLPLPEPVTTVEQSV